MMQNIRDVGKTGPTTVPQEHDELYWDVFQASGVSAHLQIERAATQRLHWIVALEPLQRTFLEIDVTQRRRGALDDRSGVEIALHTSVVRGHQRDDWRARFRSRLGFEMRPIADRSVLLQRPDRSLTARHYDATDIVSRCRSLGG